MIGRPRSNRQFHSPGFSLLEILLALSLAIVLVTAIAAAVDQAWRLTAQGQTELQRQQVARAVFRLIERDLRSVMFVPPSEFAEDEEGATTSTSSTSTSTSTSGTSSTGNSNSGSSSSGSTASAASESPEAIVLASRGIRGDQLSIEIDGTRPQREIAFALPANEALPSGRTSDLRTIRYSLAAAGQPGDPLGRGGLARKEGDRYAITSAEMSGRDASGTFSSTVIAPEIIDLQFRFSDGLQWLPTWDSVGAGRLPRAVEVQIRFAPPEVKQTVWLNAGVNRSTETARLVIFLPAADPVPAEESP